MSVKFSKPFGFKLVCYKLESLSGIVAYVSKHQSSDILWIQKYWVQANISETNLKKSFAKAELT